MSQMTISPSTPPSRRRPTWRAGLLALSWALSAHAAVPAGSPDAAWWSAFEDPVLTRLVQGSRGGAAAQLAVVQSYVALRVAQTRQSLLVRLQQAAAEQRKLLEQTEGDADERRRRIDTVAARASQWGQAQQSADAELERAEITLAALTGSERPALQLLVGTGEPDALPQVHRRLPEQAAPADAGGLQQLQAGFQQALLARQLVEASELELRSYQLRHQVGAGSSLNVLEAYQRLMVDADRLATLTGSVAVAWARLLQNGGDAALAAAP